jgi:CO/xanthine dehydrogenase FAD-binding subunit
VTLDVGNVRAASSGLGAVAATPLLASKAADALVGKKLDDASLEAAGRAASEACKPIDDMRGTIDFRVHVTGVLTRRALAIAAERAKKS